MSNTPETAKAAAAKLHGELLLRTPFFKTLLRVIPEVLLVSFCIVKAIQYLFFTTPVYPCASNLFASNTSTLLPVCPFAPSVLLRVLFILLFVCVFSCVSTLVKKRNTFVHSSLLSVLSLLVCLSLYWLYDLRYIPFFVLLVYLCALFFAFFFGYRFAFVLRRRFFKAT